MPKIKVATKLWNKVKKESPGLTDEQISKIVVNLLGKGKRAKKIDVSGRMPKKKPKRKRTNKESANAEALVATTPTEKRKKAKRKKPKARSVKTVSGGRVSPR